MTDNPELVIAKLRMQLREKPFSYITLAIVLSAAFFSLSHCGAEGAAAESAAFQYCIAKGHSPEECGDATKHIGA